MKILKQTIIVAMTMAAGITTTKAQNADEIIKKHVDAMGGIDNWNKVKTMKLKGSMSMEGMEIDMTEIIENEKGMKMEINAGGIKGFTIITPKEGWIFMPGMENVTKIPDEQVKMGQDKVNVKTGQLVDVSKIAKAEYISTDSMNGAKCYKLRVTDKGGLTTVAFIDAATYYMVRTEMTLKLKEEDMEFVINYSNFKKQPIGIVYPMTIGSDQGDVTFKSIEINKPVDRKIFKPAQK